MKRGRLRRAIVIGVLLMASLASYIYLGLTTSLHTKFGIQLYISGDHDKIHTDTLDIRNDAEMNPLLQDKESFIESIKDAENPIKTGKDDIETPPKDSLSVKGAETDDRDLNRIPQDLFALEQFPFMKNYKNPCFKDNTTGEINCLPYFYLIGAPKAGTTDMFHRLIQHPQVTPNVSKEPHWLTRTRFECKWKCRNIDYYFKKFSRAAQDIINNVDPDSNVHPMIAGDFSASTIWDHDHWYQLPENRHRGSPKHMNPDFIHHLNPNAKIITMLRNPTDRVFSDYMYFHHLDYKNTSRFHDVAVDMVKRYTQCFRKRGIGPCVFRPEPKDLRTYARIRLRIGTYSFYLKEYYRVFPKNQILILRSEDFKKNVTSTMLKVFDFLELAPVTAEKMSIISDVSQLYNANYTAKFTVGSMLPETRKVLDDFYAPFNKELELLTGITFS